ncbi:hypothetical protein HNP33_002082 [Comamonas odontotermitis]|uniref:Tail fiber protein n=1 Tax=Comamonas odontotermitis TaxID=379895 RepID=A0ABR6RFT3_9BURK|nr:hypothetical protein [Comamonas odontotermitis]MBB6578014.1 hypothetical protein [Comamonas odontotermitis]
MTAIVNPRPVRNMPPAPLDGDPPAVFDEKAKNLALWYDNWVSDNNNQAADNRQNAQATYELAQAADHSAGQAHDYAQNASDSVVAVNQTVADILAAKDAIQAGPVASVNGKTGVITGLVETSIGAARNKSQLMANAPLGQWAAYYDSSGVGADWPPGHVTTNWWNVFTFGSQELGQVTQRASQTLATPIQGWIYERQRDSAAWGPWHRVLTDRTLIESTKGGSISTSTYTLNPAEATVHQMGITASTTINLPAARTAGDQVTLCAHMQGSYTISLGANIALPIGASLPTVANGEMLMLIFTAKYDSTWYCSIAGKFPG